MNPTAYFLFRINNKRVTPIPLKYIVFYDGVCGLCNRSVNWLINHDRRQVLRYASIQSEFATKFLEGQGLDINSGTIIFSDDQELLTKSNAILRILLRMGGIYRVASVFRVIPRGFRDSVYDWLARNRYRWFGKYDTCRMPDPKTRSLFLDT